jgi:hypothetical protein
MWLGILIMLFHRSCIVGAREPLIETLRGFRASRRKGFAAQCFGK